MTEPAGQGRVQELTHDDYCRLIGQTTIDLYRVAEQIRRERDGLAKWAQSLAAENEALRAKAGG